MQLQVLVEEMGFREAPVLLPVLGAEGVVEVVRGYAGWLAGGGDGDAKGDVDVRRDLLALGTCTFVFPFLLLLYLLVSPFFLLSSLLIPQYRHRFPETNLLVPISAPTKPLSEHTTFVLGDLAHSLQDVATMATTASGKRKLAEFLDEREVRDISDFWGEEWIAD